MIIGERPRELREERKLSHGDIEKRTGLLRCYISRVRTVIPFRQSKRWKKWPERWNFRSTTSCTMATKRPKLQLQSLRMVIGHKHGDVGVKRPATFRS